MNNGDNATFMLSAVFDRKKEMKERELDPFFLLKEVAEMSNLRNLNELKDGASMK